MTKKKRIYFKTEEIITKTKTGWIELETDFIQMYRNAWKYLVKLKRPVSSDFILWILFHVDDNNMFPFNQSVFHEFNKELEVEAGRTYSRQSVEFALRELKNVGIIRSVDRGRYQINPGVFWSDDQNSRIETVKVLDQMQTDAPPFKLGTPVQKIEAAQGESTTKNDVKQLNPASEVMKGLAKKTTGVVFGKGLIEQMTNEPTFTVMTQEDADRIKKQIEEEVVMPPGLMTQIEQPIEKVNIQEIHIPDEPIDEIAEMANSNSDEEVEQNNTPEAEGKFDI